MTELHRTATVPYTTEQMFVLVNDIESYPDFLPWCTGTKILEQHADEIVATIELSAMGVHQSFTTRNRLVPSTRMEMEHVDGPLKSLLGIWRFHDINGEGCKIELEIDFEVRSGLKMALFGMVFSKIADKLVESFCERAEQLYGV